MRPRAPETRRIYLDHASTSPLRPCARQAIENAWDAGLGNAASAHAEGRAARAVLAEARARVGVLVGAQPEEVIFTGSATEASNLAIRGALRVLAGDRRKIVSTAVEHSATRRACEALAAEGHLIELLRPDSRGRIDAAALARAVGRGATLVSVIAAHNELAAVQPLLEIAEAAHEAGALLHLDAVQAAAAIDLSQTPWEYLSLSAHKLGGPVGIGALVVRASSPIAPLIVGGGQERGLRSGTVPVALAAGFAAAAEEALAGRQVESRRLAFLRGRLGEALLGSCSGLRAIGAWRDADGASVPHIATLGLDGVRSDELVAALDEAGVACSSSSACLGDARSHVLEAIGLPERTGVFRLSLGWSTSDADVETSVPRILGALERLAKAGAFDRRAPIIESRAADAGLSLTPIHWEVAEAVFLLHVEKGILPGARHLSRLVGNGTKIDHLFPGGLATLATWLGIPLPQSGCRPGPV